MFVERENDTPNFSIPISGVPLCIVLRTALQQCSNYFLVVGVGVSFAEPSEARLTYFHRAREEKPTTWRRHRRRLGRGNDRIGIVGSSDTPTWAHYRELALPFAITTVSRPTERGDEEKEEEEKGGSRGENTELPSAEDARRKGARREGVEKGARRATLTRERDRSIGYLDGRTVISTTNISAPHSE